MVPGGNLPVIFRSLNHTSSLHVHHMTNLPPTNLAPVGGYLEDQTPGGTFFSGAMLVGGRVDLALKCCPPPTTHNPQSVPRRAAACRGAETAEALHLPQALQLHLHLSVGFYSLQTCLDNIQASTDSSASLPRAKRSLPRTSAAHVFHCLLPQSSAGHGLQDLLPRVLAQKGKSF